MANARTTRTRRPRPFVTLRGGSSLWRRDKAASAATNRRNVSMNYWRRKRTCANNTTPSRAASRSDPHETIFLSSLHSSSSGCPTLFGNPSSQNSVSPLPSPTSWEDTKQSFVDSVPKQSWATRNVVLCSRRLRAPRRRRPLGQGHCVRPSAGPEKRRGHQRHDSGGNTGRYQVEDGQGRGQEHSGPAHPR